MPYDVIEMLLACCICDGGPCAAVLCWCAAVLCWCAAVLCWCAAEDCSQPACIYPLHHSTHSRTTLNSAAVRCQGVIFSLPSSARLDQPAPSIIARFWPGESLFWLAVDIGVVVAVVSLPAHGLTALPLRRDVCTLNSPPIRLQLSGCHLRILVHSISALDMVVVA